MILDKKKEKTSKSRWPVTDGIRYWREIALSLEVCLGLSLMFLGNKILNSSQTLYSDKWEVYKVFPKSHDKVYIVPREFVKTRLVNNASQRRAIKFDWNITPSGHAANSRNYDRRLLIIVYGSWVEITLTSHASTKYREILGRYFLDQICPQI